MTIGYVVHSTCLPSCVFGRIGSHKPVVLAPETNPVFVTNLATAFLDDDHTVWIDLVSVSRGPDVAMTEAILGESKWAEISLAELQMILDDSRDGDGRD